MKLLYFGLLVCVLASLVNAIYIPSFQVQDAESPFIDDVNANSELIKECGSDNDILIIDHINLTPEIPVRGETLNIDFQGYLKKKVENGAYVDIVVKYRFVQLIKKRFQLCEEGSKIDINCPLEKGPLTINKDVELPKEIPPGKYTVDAQVFTVDDEDITCLHGVTEFPKY